MESEEGRWISNIKKGVIDRNKPLAHFSRFHNVIFSLLWRKNHDEHLRKMLP